MNIQTRISIEKKIAKAVVREAIKLGYTFEIDNGGDFGEEIKTTHESETLKEMFATDQDELYLIKDGKKAGWVYFVYGNDGYDVISDYTVNLEDLLKPAIALASKLESQYA
jgi:hypothetical protein